MTDKVWKHFHALCAIPRPSGHEREAVRYVKDTAETLGLEWQIDAAGNIIVRKNASAGMEGRAGVVLQSHLDMVPQKNEGTVHDFLKDPISTYVDDEGWMRARGTTLGADNGIGAAAALAVLEDRGLKHGPIEALFTADEEAGMTGARALEAGVLRGGAMINLDTEDEGEIYIGCAGGVDVSAVIPIDFIEYNGDDAEILLSITGLRGGHSGLDINLGRDNAIKVLARLLRLASAEFSIALSSIRGGNVRNAIPREAFCEIIVPRHRLDDFGRCIGALEEDLKEKLSSVDPDIKIGVGKPGAPLTRVMAPESQSRLIEALCECPNGVISMSGEAPGVVETSGNLAIVSTSGSSVDAHCLLRSLIDGRRDDLAADAASVFRQHGAEVKISGEYPGWKPNPNSRLLVLMKDIYRKTFGEEASVKVVHAGLECGIIAAKYPNMEFVSIGPTIKYPHSPDECLDIASVEKFWKYLTAVIGAL